VNSFGRTPSTAPNKQRAKQLRAKQTARKTKTPDSAKAALIEGCIAIYESGLPATGKYWMIRSKHSQLLINATTRASSQSFIMTKI
jgi:hypothetical protein